MTGSFGRQFGDSIHAILADHLGLVFWQFHQCLRALAQHLFKLWLALLGFALNDRPVARLEFREIPKERLWVPRDKVEQGPQPQGP